MKRLVILILSLIAFFNAQAMKIEVHKNIVYASGSVGDDIRAFEEAFAKPDVDTVVFVNSPGGSLYTGLRVGNMIADKNLKTVIAGTCASACSIMFMGGKERTFSDAFPPSQTYIGIHGAHNPETKNVNPVLQPQIYAFYKHYMTDKFDSAIMNTALNDMDDYGALLRVFDNGRTPKRIPYHCKSYQSLRSTCTEYKDHDATSLGIVTNATLTKLDLPDGYKTTPLLFGKTFTNAFSDPENYFKNLAETNCKEFSCRARITFYNAYKQNKALAAGADGHGLSSVGSRDSPIFAFTHAVYQCNHPKDEPTRLCEAVSVNDFDVRDIYINGAKSHVEGLSKLIPPTENNYAGEEFGGGFTSANGLRTSKWNDITPQKLDGIQTYSTQMLATAIKSEKPPVLIDVLAPSSVSIPSAVALYNGGLAYSDPIREQSYDSRFANLLQLISPDKSKPIIFYCAGRDLWFSVNAALRAQKLGYTKVGWYRGGMTSWKAANLPLANPMIRAVVQ